MLLQIDLANAFNCIDRTAVTDGVRQYYPQLQAWTQFCYAEPSLLFIGGKTILSQEGVQQGDPLGPLLFSLAWQLLPISLPASHLTLNSWYLDDGVLVMPRENVEPVLQYIKSMGQTLGVQLNTSKTTMWGPGNTAEWQGTLPADSLTKALNHLPYGTGRGVRVLGVPVGITSDDSYVADYLRKTQEELQRITRLLPQLGHSQTSFFLLRGCADACRFNHLLRSVDTTPEACQNSLRRT